MKSKLLLPLFLGLALLFGGLGMNKAYADHISAIDFYADYIGTGPNDMKYRVTFVLYRICVGPNLQLGDRYGTTTVSIPSMSWSKNLDPVSVLHDDGKGNMVMEDTLDYLCPEFSKINSCRVMANTAYSGYTRRFYVDTVTVPYRSNDLTFSWTACCRLSAYTNIDGLASASFWVQCGINNIAKYDNSTPRYNSLPFTFSCVNQPTSLSNVPIDPNGDSLYTYKIDANTTDGNTFVTFLPGFTSALPTGIGGAYSVGPVSGKASFTATSPGRYVLAYRTRDYDRNTKELLGYASRDLTITVLPCTNLPPYIDSIPQGVTGVKKVDITGGEVVLLACPQAPLNFTVNSHSNNPDGRIYMYPASTLPPGMTIVPTVTGGTAYATVNWNPTAADIGTHIVSIIAVDSTCALGQEITLRNEFTFTVDVRPAFDAGPDLLGCRRPSVEA